MPAFKDLTGQTFGRLTVISRSDIRVQNKTTWVATCSCANKTQKLVTSSALVSGNTRSCGCLQHEQALNCIDLVGQKFGKLLVLERAGRTRGTNAAWKCKCDCGTVKDICSTDLRNTKNKTRSCGCGKYPLTSTIYKPLFFTYRQSAKSKGFPFELSEEYFAELIQQPCTYCGDYPSREMADSYQNRDSRRDYSNFRWNGIDRINSLLGYIEGNVVPCCKLCNRMKSNRTVDEFRAAISAIYSHMNLGAKGVSA